MVMRKWKKRGVRKETKKTRLKTRVTTMPELGTSSVLRRNGDDGRDGVLEGALLGVGLCEDVDAGGGRDDTPRAEKCEHGRSWGTSFVGLSCSSFV